MSVCDFNRVRNKWLYGYWLITYKYAVFNAFATIRSWTSDEWWKSYLNPKARGPWISFIIMQCRHLIQREISHAIQFVDSASKYTCRVNSHNYGLIFWFAKQHHIINGKFQTYNNVKHTQIPINGRYAGNTRTAHQNTLVCTNKQNHSANPMQKGKHNLRQKPMFSYRIPISQCRKSPELRECFEPPQANMAEKF